MTESSNPPLCDVYRKDIVESRHRGSVLVVDADGREVLSLGDTERAIYPRSAIKFFQAVPLVESGAADHFGLDQRELSFACASHDGEAFHVEAADAWLQRLGLSESDLENGPALPANAQALATLYGNGQTPNRMHQNCSGKHCGMLTVSRHLDAPVAGYSGHDHPSQAAWMSVLSEFAGLDVSSLPWERDGCGLPAICMPMPALALACARFSNADSLPEVRAASVGRIRDALAAYPLMMAGSERCCSAVIAQTGGRVLVKTGAEGVFTGFIPEHGLGLVIKIDDGASRASEVALGAALRRIDAITDGEYRDLGHYFTPEVKNSQGWTTGQILPSAAWGLD